jgi:hypothetical protein
MDMKLYEISNFNIDNYVLRIQWGRRRIDVTEYKILIKRSLWSSLYIINRPTWNGEVQAKKSLFLTILEPSRLYEI